MSATDWKRIKDVFHEALRFEAGERERFLERECGQDIEMRIEVESLLISLDEAKDFLEQPAMGQPESSAGSTILLPDKHISHYKIISHIASGGMGEIYLAEDLKLRRKVALKVLHEILPSSTEQIKRFQREAAVVSSLNHPNILTIYDIDTENEIHLFASEFVNGVTLRDRLKKGPIPIAEAIEIGIQMLSALDAAHEAGVTHRDIKPENIMLRSDGLVKVLDFGLAKIAKPKTVDGSALTWEQIFSQPGMIMGTAAYMSPEQARGKPLDGRTDIFSSGVVLYEMLTGAPPFSGQTTTDVIASLIQDEVRPPSLRNPNVPPGLDQIVLKMLHKDRDGRHSSAAEPLADLRHEKDRLGRSEPSGDELNEEAQDAAVPVIPPAEHSTTESPRSGVRIYLLLILAALAIAVLIIYLFGF